MKYVKFYLLVFALLGIAFSALSQDTLPIWKKLRYLSEEEMYMDVRSPDEFVETDPPFGPIRNVAEFDPMQAVLVRYPFGVPVSLMEELSKDIEVITIVATTGQENTVRSIYEANNVNLDNCSFLQAPTNSWWVRDYGPWFVFDGNNQPGILDFPYNRPRPQDNDIPGAVAEYLGIDLYGMNLLHTGGNYMTDGLGKSSSTDLITEENPELSEQEIDTLLKKYLAIDQYYVLPDPLDDYIKHIDCWGKFLTPNKVIIGQVAESDYRYEDFEAAATFFENRASSYGVPYEVFRVYTPGGSPATPYTNSLIANDKIFVPLSGSQWDDEAIQAYKDAMPGYKIIGIQHNGWFNTDALHCRAKGVADLGMLYIQHIPLTGIQAYSPNVQINAEFIAYSGAEIYADSAFLHYRINDGDYQTGLFDWTADSSWNYTISELQPLDEVDYYIEIMDRTGRKARHPYIGAFDPHEFNLNAFVPEIIITPDTLYLNADEDMLNGLEVSVFNNFFSPTEIIEVVLPDRPEFTVKLIDLPSIPYMMSATENLTFKIALEEPLPPMGTLITDRIELKTDTYTYPVYFTIDRTGGINVVDQNFMDGISVFPNPSDHQFVFTYQLSHGQDVKLEIFSGVGERIYVFVGSQPFGSHKLTWDVNAGDKNGISGVYFYRLTAGKEVQEGKIIVQ